MAGIKRVYNHAFCALRMKERHRISIIIPVWNEMSIINQTIKGIFRLEYNGDIEIIVVDADPEGKTIKAIQDNDVIKATSEKGRAKQMNKGASIAGGDILLFLHADTGLPENALDDIFSAVEKGYKCGAFNLGIKSERFVFRIIESAVNIRTRLTHIPYGDQAIFAEKEYFEGLGGFPDVPLMEDVEIMREIKRRGDKIRIVHEKVMTSPRRWEKEGVIRCTLRNRALITLYYLGVSPKRLARFYF